MKKKRRAPKKPRRGSPLAVAHKIAKLLQGLKIHGRFEVEKLVVDDTLYERQSSDPSFHWLATAEPNWIEFRALFFGRYRQDIADLGNVARAFLGPLIKSEYTGRSIAMVRTVIGDDEGEEGIEWRSLTATHKMRYTLQQIEGAVEEWENRPNYIAATGFAVRIELT